MAIFLVRHAESEANIDESIFRTTGDHAIKLSEKGLIQAEKVGDYLNNFIGQNIPQGEKVRLWASSTGGQRKRQKACMIMPRM